MNAQAYPMFESIQMKPRMISGVCGYLAERAGLPLWVVRVIALVMVCSHPPLALLLYFGLAIWLHGRTRGTWRAMRTGASWQASSAAPNSRSGLCDRFSHLDRRLADLEAAVMDREASLRRAFRDLDR